MVIEVLDFYHFGIPNMSIFMSKYWIPIIPRGSKEIKSFCQTCQFWSKTIWL